MKLLVNKDDLNYLSTLIDDRRPKLRLLVAKMLSASKLAEKIKADPEAMDSLRNKLWRYTTHWAYEGGEAEVNSAMIGYLQEVYPHLDALDCDVIYDELHMELL